MQYADFNQPPKNFNHPPQIKNGPQGYSSTGKIMKMTNYKNGEEDEEEDPSDHFDQDYLQHKLNKCKS